VTAAAGDDPPRRLAVRRLDAPRAGGVVDLREGRYTIGVTIHTRFDIRLRGAFELKIPGG
jgi:hypothetical protein